MRALLVSAILLVAARHAAAGECRVLGVDYEPAPATNPDPGLRLPLSIVAWLETPGGTFVDTVFITQQVGTYGLGNRPGRVDFNSGPHWPYGRRVTTFPVWAHRHGLSWDQIVFQDGHDDNLSHTTNESSRETHYFAPMVRDNPQWDAITHASITYTDKGTFGGDQSLYPPRQDVMKAAEDAASVTKYDELNPFDAISQASPGDGQPSTFSWAVPPELPAGDYVLWMEVSREFDHNATYSVAARPSPMVSYGEYGMPYRGQPSVVYKVPFALGDATATATGDAYVGYGDPDGLDGVLRAPDGTITTDVVGSGAQRLALIPGKGYRIQVTAGPDPDTVAPSEAGDMVATSTSTTAVLTFVAPGDDGRMGSVAGYEVRYLVGEDVTAENFDRATEIRPTFTPVPGGALESMTFEKLLPDTNYSIGIRAYDNCHNASPLTVVNVQTLTRAPGEVDACFIATAAYGSLMANDVELLRRFRDLALEHSVIGELAVETYYTFGPAAAGVVGESELLRWTARDVLQPIVDRVRRWRW